MPALIKHIPKKLHRESLATVILVSIACHIVLVCGIIGLARSLYKSKTFIRPTTFDVVRFQNLFDIPNVTQKPAAPSASSQPTAQSQPAQSLPLVNEMPKQLTDQTPVPVQNSRVAPAIQPVAAPAAIAQSGMVSQAQNATSGSGSESTGNTVYEEGMVDQAPVCIKKVEPAYPAFVREQEISGIVSAKIVIDENGNVAQITILKSPHKILAEAASIAIGKWKYQPGKYKGHAVKVQTRTIEIKFELNE